MRAQENEQPEAGCAGVCGAGELALQEVMPAAAYYGPLLPLMMRLLLLLSVCEMGHKSMMHRLPRAHCADNNSHGTRSFHLSKVPI